MPPVVMPLLADILFSIAIVLMGFVVFAEALSDYRLVTSIKKVMSKKFVVNPAAPTQSIALQFQSGIVRGYFRVVRANLSGGGEGSVVVSKDRIIVKLPKVLGPLHEFELSMIVSIRGKLDEYFVRTRSTISLSE